MTHQRRVTHDSFLARQDAELRLLDIMKRTLLQKAKCDRDYASGLTNVAQRGLKVDRINDMQGSQLAKGWRSYMDAMEDTARQLRLNAEYLEKVCQEHLTQLCQDKRKVRESYQEELNKIWLQLDLITEEVGRKQTEYQKDHEVYKALESKFEEHYVKSGRSSRKVGDVADKYKKACRKLHLSHNEYVLLINEAVEVEKDVRIILIPGLLERQHALQENFLLTWKNILLDVARLSDWNSVNFLEIQKRVIAGMESINPANEYTESTPSIPVTFQFNESLIEGNLCKLKVNTLAVDNLTHNWLKNRLRELEASVRECQEKQIKLSTESKTPISSTPTVNGYDLIKDININTKEFNSLNCQERRMLKLIEMIKTALNEMGCDDLSPQCDDLLLEPSYVNVTITKTRSLYEEEWFHGVLPRGEVIALLKHDGDFLVRKTTRNETVQIVCSVCWNGHKHFIVQITSEGHYRFEGPTFASIQELVLHHYHSQMAVTSKSGAILKRPVLRERWELNNDDVLLLDNIGCGNFGEVYKARLKSNPHVDVAVKTYHMTLPQEHKQKFFQEGRILKQYDHPNIVKLIGICVQRQPIMIVMELVAGGSLLMFLKEKSDTITTIQLMRMCRDTAAGMKYLESKNCIHRDLAARNCLVGDNQVVKISDFGMSREGQEYIISVGKKQIPIRWTAPEALNFGKYTSLSDIWSYGVLLYEIFSRGGVPYEEMNNITVKEQIDAGYRLPPPDNTPKEIYRLMLKCWAHEPDNRPHFDEIFTLVDALTAIGVE